MAIARSLAVLGLLIGGAILLAGNTVSMTLLYPVDASEEFQLGYMGGGFVIMAAGSAMIWFAVRLHKKKAKTVVA